MLVLFRLDIVSIQLARVPVVFAIKVHHKHAQLKSVHDEYKDMISPFTFHKISHLYKYC